MALGNHEIKFGRAKLHRRFLETFPFARDILQADILRVKQFHKRRGERTGAQVSDGLTAD